MRDYENLATDDELLDREQVWVTIPWNEWYGGSGFEDPDEGEGYDHSADNIEYGRYGEVVSYLYDEVFGFIVGRPSGERLWKVQLMGIDADKYFHMIGEALESGDRGLISNVVNACQDRIGVWSPTGYGFDYEGWELVVRFE